MILIDTNIWVDHLRTSVAALSSLLAREEALMHPYVLGELALGGLRDRQKVLERWAALLPAPVAAHEVVLALIETEGLFGSGIGYVDAHLLASAKLSGDAELWTRDRRLSAAARRLGISVPTNVFLADT